MGSRQLQLQFQALLQSGTGTLESKISGLPANSPLRKYAEYQLYQDPTKHELPSSSVPDKNGFTARIVHPFSIDYATGEQSILINARLTGRANTFVNDTLSATLRGKLNFVASNSAGIQLPSTKQIQAAKVLFKKEAETKSSRTSRITGRKYKAGKPDSYTVPLGRKSQADNYSDAVVDIIAAKEVDGSGVKGDLWSIDFRQEVWNLNVIAVSAA